METTKMTYNTFIQWFNAKKVKPSEDGSYLCCTAAGTFTQLSFVVKHQLFNVSDDCTDHAIDVAWWAPLPELPHEEVDE